MRSLWVSCASERLVSIAYFLGFVNFVFIFRIVMCLSLWGNSGGVATQQGVVLPTRLMPGLIWKLQVLVLDITALYIERVHRFDHTNDPLTHSACLCNCFKYDTEAIQEYEKINNFFFCFLLLFDCFLVWGNDRQNYVLVTILLKMMKI